MTPSIAATTTIAAAGSDKVEYRKFRAAGWFAPLSDQAHATASATATYNTCTLASMLDVAVPNGATSMQLRARRILPPKSGLLLPHKFPRHKQTPSLRAAPCVCSEVRVGDTKVLSLLDMPRPFTKLKGIDDWLPVAKDAVKALK